MIHVFGTALVWLAIVATARAADNFDELKHQFDNDPKEALDVKEVLLYERDGAKVYDVTYTSPTGGRVTAYLVVPAGKGPRAKRLAYVGTATASSRPAAVPVCQPRAAVPPQGDGALRRRRDRSQDREVVRRRPRPQRPSGAHRSGCLAQGARRTTFGERNPPEETRKGLTRRPVRREGRRWERTSRASQGRPAPTRTRPGSGSFFWGEFAERCSYYGTPAQKEGER